MIIGSPIHSFNECLARSHSYSEAPWWEQIYRSAFGGFASMTNVRADGWAQRGGIDRVVVLKSGKTLTIDEKVREKDYGDILLERWSDKERRVPGWVQKELACDFIAYAIAPIQTCWLLPFQPLRRAWRTNGKAWIDLYGTIIAHNRSYKTESVPVPIPVLMDAIQGAFIFHWGASSPQAQKQHAFID